MGRVFSGYIYSYVKNTPIFLRNKDTYHRINSLSVNVATPPSTNTNLLIRINNRKYTFLGVKKNLLLITNAFPSSGEYNINIVGTLVRKDQYILKADTLKELIFVN